MSRRSVYTFRMPPTFEWDEAKRQRVLQERGIDFVDAQAVLDGRPAYTYPSTRTEEERWVTVAHVEGKSLAVVWTPRGTNIRIITARRARDGERRAYRALHG
jgi:uncharacterized protein